MDDMFGSMDRVTIWVTSKAFPSVPSTRKLEVPSSNNVVEAAWDAGIGVFALIWVRAGHFIND